MSDRATKRASGFSLLEMTIAMALGTVVLGAAVQIYSQGVAATWTVSQRAEMQQDFRDASNLLTKDLSLAGAGLNPGASIALPAGVTPVYGCAQASGTPCYLGASNNVGLQYPVQSGTPHLYGLLTGYIGGPQPTGAPAATDVVTAVYTDNNFYLDCYTATVTSATVVTFALPGSTSANCTAPTGNSGAQAVNDSGVGLTVGDLVLFTFGSSSVVAEVTTTATAAGVTTFAASDALKMNQGASVANSLASEYVASPPTTGYGIRLLAITYYIDSTVTPPRLMRQISGHLPMPVAENIAYMKFSYDLYNDTTNTPTINQCNPGAASISCNPSPGSVGLLPNQITKINILHMAMDSTLKGARGGYSGLDLETSVSARNLTYNNNYAVN
jgi:prepilin-type N-terminal cleavage/methylation domain-containing protein